MDVRKKITLTGIAASLAALVSCSNFSHTSLSSTKSPSVSQDVKDPPGGGCVGSTGCQGEIKSFSRCQGADGDTISSVDLGDNNGDGN